MSHFTCLKTQMVEKEHLQQALADLEYACQDGLVDIRGYGGNRTPVDLKIVTQNPGYDIGFQQAGNAYDVVADWWGIRDIKQEQCLQQVTQRYAYHTARAKLEGQGFALVSEQDVVSSCRRVTCAKAAAGKRHGTAGTKSGQAYLQWACSASAVLVLRDHPAGQQSLARREQQPGQGKAVTLLAQTLGRAVYEMFTRQKTFDMHTLLHASCAQWVRLTPHWTCLGCACTECAAMMVARRQCTPRSTEAIPPALSAVAWTPPPAPRPHGTTPARLP